MLRRLLRTPHTDVEVGVAIPIGCMLPLAIAAAVLGAMWSFLSSKRPA